MSEEKYAVIGSKYGLCDYCGKSKELTVIRGFGQICEGCRKTIVRMLEVGLDKSVTIQELHLAFKKGLE